jgi:hypothetical protein
MQHDAEDAAQRQHGGQRGKARGGIREVVQHTVAGV